MESRGIELLWQVRLITIGFDPVGVLEAVATEFIFVGYALHNIYINLAPYDYSQD